MTRYKLAPSASASLAFHSFILYRADIFLGYSHKDVNGDLVALRYKTNYEIKIDGKTKCSLII